MLVCAASVSVSTNVYARNFSGKLMDLDKTTLNPVVPPPSPNQKCNAACVETFNACEATGHCITENVLPLIPNTPVCDPDVVLNSCGHAMTLCIRACNEAFP